jgi:two-component system sensor histidine kinase KdpD
MSTESMDTTGLIAGADRTALLSGPPGIAAKPGLAPSTLARGWGRARPYLVALLLCAVITAGAFPFSPAFNATNVAMLYLLGTTIAALRLGRGPAILLCVANLLALDFFFVPPIFSLEMSDVPYTFTFGVALSVALIVTNLLARARHHANLAEAGRRRASLLHSLSRELCAQSTVESMTAIVERDIGSVFGCATMVLLEDEARLSAAAGIPVRSPDAMVVPWVDFTIARAVLTDGARRVDGTAYLPLHGHDRILGVLAVKGAAPALDDDNIDLLDAFAAQLALALNRVKLTDAVRREQVAAERTRLSNTLLASISHDLRTPLSAIAGGGALIAQADYALTPDSRATLGQLIERKAHDMIGLLSKVLELSRLEAGVDSLRTDWQTVDDLVTTALRENAGRLAQRRVLLEIPAGLPSILVEGTLIVQLLNNLLENAVKYTPPGTTITIGAAVRGEAMVISVADDGPGLPPARTATLFEKFERGSDESAITGAGLGLAICRATAHLHGGEILALDRPVGACFELTLPVRMLEETAVPVA